MSKSPVVVGAIGIAGCLALGLTMREALEMMQQSGRDPLELALESRFGAVLASPVRVVNRLEDRRVRVLVELHVLTKTEPDRLAETAGQLVWDCRLAAGSVPDEVVVGVTNSEGQELRSLSAPRPRSRR